MSDVASVRSFYGRYAPLYDLVATAPGVGRLRAAAAEALDVDRGDAVVEMGCGTGANFRHLRERVGPEGRVVGVDVTPAVLARARDRAAAWDNVAVLRGDATRPPVAGPVDGVLATFVVGMVPDPAATIGDWLSLLAPDGRVALLDAAPSPVRGTAPLNVAFRLAVRVANPGGLTAASPDRLDARVEAAHGAVADRAADAREDYRALGFVRLTSGRSE